MDLQFAEVATDWYRSALGDLCMPSVDQVWGMSAKGLAKKVLPEEAVLTGAGDTLKRWKPVLLIEIEERHNPGGLQRIAKSLSQLGYSGSFFYDRKRYDLTQFDPDLHQGFDDLAQQTVDGAETNRRELKYVNNFVFCAL